MRSIILAAALAITAPAWGHDIYTGVHGKNGQLCCGGNDCAATIYRERGNYFEFMKRDGKWVRIPSDRITWLPIPGDPPSDNSHLAHLCYRDVKESDKLGAMAANVIDDIYFYCAFIPPGGM